MIRVVVTFERHEIEFDAVFEFETLDLALSFVNDIAACTITKIAEFTICRSADRQSKHRKDKKVN